MPGPANTRTLGFSVHGPAIMNVAREKFYQSRDFCGAMDLLLACLVTDEISMAERVETALRILDGHMEMTGTYPVDFNVVELPEKDPRYDIKTAFRAQRDEIEALRKEIDGLREAICFIGENLDDGDLSSLDREADEYLGRQIFGTLGRNYNPRPDIIDTGNPVADGLVRDYLDRQHRMRDDPEIAESDYGWLEPSGKFHPVPFCEHLQFACDWVENLIRQAGSEQTRRHIRAFSPDDYLHHLGWVLLHNPYMGNAKIEKDPTISLTNAQVKFLYEYYKSRGLDRQADAVLRQ